MCLHIIGAMLEVAPSTTSEVVLHVSGTPRVVLVYVHVVRVSTSSRR